LPFPDDSFDLVTCQTLLIHVSDPAAVIAEMCRVARPGGLVLACEPNNVSRALLFDSMSAKDPADAILARVRFQLLCERGKAALGEGDNSIGDLVPGLFSAGGLVDLSVYLNDKANLLAPPYDTPEQHAMVEEQADFNDRGFWIWSCEDTRRYFLAGGGRDDEFDALWSEALRDGDELRQSIAERTYSGAGAAIGYIVAGRKPDRKSLSAKEQSL
jgi:SAM-dependent methyltransferase